MVLRKEGSAPEFQARYISGSTQGCKLYEGEDLLLRNSMQIDSVAKDAFFQLIGAIQWLPNLILANYDHIPVSNHPRKSRMTIKIIKRMTVYDSV